VRLAGIFPAFFLLIAMEGRPMKSSTWIVILTVVVLFGCGSKDVSIQKIEQILTYIRNSGNQIILEVETVP